MFISVFGSSEFLCHSHLPTSSSLLSGSRSVSLRFLYPPIAVSISPPSSGSRLFEQLALKGLPNQQQQQQQPHCPFRPVLKLTPSHDLPLMALGAKVSGKLFEIYCNSVRLSQTALSPDAFPCMPEGVLAENYARFCLSVTRCILHLLLVRLPVAVVLS